MNQISQIIIDGPGVRTQPAEDYHRSPGASKSILDLVHQSPALIDWSRDAPVDEEAKTAVNIGTALHSLLLEPDNFAADYVGDFNPPPGALVTIADLRAAMDKRGIAFLKGDDKATLTAKLLGQDPNAPVADKLAEEWAKGINGRTVLSAAEYRKLILMRDSIMAHPTARKLLETPGHTERCHYWVDEETGELCRCRPDREIPKFGMILDVKTTGEIAKFSDSIREYRYHVQDVFYSDGWAATQGETLRAFVFLAISTARDRGRYPVHLYSITPLDRDVGRTAVREDMATYAKCRRTNNWPGIETISLPAWYVAKQGV